MRLSVEGDYFEVCNCDVSCNCVWLGAATNDNCDVLLAWHVTRGSKEGVDLSGLNACDGGALAEADDRWRLEGGTVSG